MAEDTPNMKRKLAEDEPEESHKRYKTNEEFNHEASSSQHRPNNCTNNYKEDQLIVTCNEKENKTSSSEENVEVELTGSNTQQSSNIADLPVCVLLHLLRFLDATSLYQLSRTCELFRELVLDRALWRVIDGRLEPNKRKKIKYFQNRIYSRTTDIRLAGVNQAHLISNFRFFKDSSLNLSVLALENQYLDANKTPLSSFPKTLEELSLRATFVEHAKGVFMQNASKVLTKLRVFILDDCQWLSSEVFMSLSKLPNLEILSMYKCKQKTSADICYLSLAGSLGFEKLKVMNCRFTAVADETLKVMYKHPRLQELYFECYERTYSLEKAQRELDILTGKDKPKPNSYLNEEYYINDTNKRFMNKYFGDGKFSVKTTNTLGDSATHWYLNVVSGPVDGPPGKSRLYQPQYGPCNCGFHEKFWNTQDGASQSNDEEASQPITDFQQRLCRPPCYYFKYVGLGTKKIEIDNVIIWLKRKIRRDLYRIRRDHVKPIFMVRPDHDEFHPHKNIPELLNTSATRENKSRHFLFVREPENLYEIEMVNYSAKDYSYIDIPLFRMVGGDHDYHHRNIIHVDSDVSMLPYECNTRGESSVSESSSKNAEDSNKSNDCNNSDSPGTQKYWYPYYKAGSENDDSYTELSSDEESSARYVVNKCIPIKKRMCPNNDDGNKLNDRKSKSKRMQNGKGRIRRLSYSDSSCPSGNEGDEENPNVRLSTRRTLKHLRERRKQRSSKNKKKQSTKIGSECAIEDCSSESDSEGKIVIKFSNTEPGTSNNRHLDGEGNEQVNRELITLRRDLPYDPARVHILEAPNVLIHDIIYINLRANADNNFNIELRPAAIPDKPKIQLKKLSVRGFSEITDRTLQHLENIELDLLDVTYTNVTAGGVRNYILKHPNTRVLHETACTCRPYMEF